MLINLIIKQVDSCSLHFHVTGTVEIMTLNWQPTTIKAAYMEEILIGLILTEVKSFTGMDLTSTNFNEIIVTDDTVLICINVIEHLFVLLI